MSQGTLQAIFEYQTAICELTGMDVSNASGYDGTTVAADACLVARAATGATKMVVTETLNPQVREVVRTFAPGFGMEVVEVAHSGGVTDPAAVRGGRSRRGLRDLRPAQLLRLPRGAPALTAVANDAGAVSVAHVDPMTLGLLEAPGAYGCADRVGEGQSAGKPARLRWTPLRLHGIDDGARAAASGADRGQTVDTRGRRGFVLTLQTREQHIRREKATSNITTNQTLLALCGLVYLSWLGPAGPARGGQACLSLAKYAKGALGPRAGVRPARPSRSSRSAPTVRAARWSPTARKLGVHPGYALGPSTRGWTTCSWWRSPSSGRAPTSTGWPRCSRRSGA